MSGRVHALIEEEALALERYSIGEAFATFPGLSRENLGRLDDRLRRRIKSRLRIPVRVDIGSKKTLATVAGQMATDGSNSQRYTLS